MIKVLLVCHGNICRSTMAESLLTHQVKQAGIEKQFEIASAGTSREELGQPVHRGTVQKLKQKSVPVVEHYAVQVKRADLEYYDYILVMDSQNLRNMERMFGKQEKVKRLLEFVEDSSDQDIADPWYTGDFEKTYKDLERGLEAFLRFLGKNK